MRNHIDPAIRRLSRRQFLRQSSATSLWLAAPHAFAAARLDTASASSQIDRRAWVQRHNPAVSRFDPFAALSVGNGEFAFTADITGLQTFSAQCDKSFPLCTAAHWAWHTAPLPDGVRPEQFRYKDYDTHGRPVGYATDAKGQEPLFNWLRQNPHGLHLGRLGFDLRSAGGEPVQPDDLKNVRQTLDLWTGLMESRFEFEGSAVRVWTCCHPEQDAVAVRIESPLLAAGKLAVALAFPGPSPEVNMADWAHPERQETELSRRGPRRVEITRKFAAGQRTFAALEWTGDAELTPRAAHEFVLRSKAGRVLELVCGFSAKAQPAALPRFEHARSASAGSWQRFWQQGGAIDLRACTDPRAPELERRMVLSLYQTALHCAGSLPSAETGLLCNSWYGKFHLEMHWWHGVHFAAWGRFPLFQRSLGFYQRILPVARELARRQGYPGARWPKMVGPDGHDAPSAVGPLLIWQQPHPIYYAELAYRETPNRATLETWRDVVDATAEFMAAYAFHDPHRKEFVLGPPLKTVSENADPLTTVNPTFELAYWRTGLRLAQTWRERLGRPREARWDEVRQGLSPLPMQDGLYLMQEGMTDTYTKWNWEHPALLGAFGMQPGDGVDPAAMRRTLRRVIECWQWERTWGWDFPMAAMAAARVGEPELAIRALLIDVPKNRHWPNGHNFQRNGLTAYLPGNGGLLAALAMMAAGWTDGPRTPAPGFPADGKWQVRSEGLRRWL